MGILTQKKLPTEAYTTSSIEQYELLCEAAAENLPELLGSEFPATFDLRETLVRNNRGPGHNGDGRYLLRYADAKEDFFCLGHVDTFAHETRVEFGRLSTQKDRAHLKGHPLTIIPMKDACSLTRSIEAGELGGKTCHDGGDPKILAAAQDPGLISLQVFANYCRSAHQNYLLHTAGTLGRPALSLEQARVEFDPFHPAFYQLALGNTAATPRERDFACQAQIDRAANTMVLGAGRFQNSQWLTLEDSCALEKALNIPGADRCVDPDPLSLALKKSLLGPMGWIVLPLGAYFTWKTGSQALAWGTLKLAEKLPGLGRTLTQTSLGRDALSRFSRRKLPAFWNWQGGKNFWTLEWTDRKSGREIGFWKKWVRRLMGRGPTLELKEIPLETRIDRMFQKARGPGWKKWPFRGLAYGWEALTRNMGLATFLGYVYDAVAAGFVDRDHRARRLGTPAVGLGSLGVLTLLDHRAITRSLGSGKSAATLASRHKALGTANRIGNRLILLGLADWATGALMMDGDYEASVKKRTTDRVYEQDKVYDYLPEDFDWMDDGLLGLSKPLRGGVRWLAPSLMEWGVSAGNASMETAIRREDQRATFEIKQAMKEALPALTLQKAEFDFAPLGQRAEPETLLKQFQEAAIFLRFVPGPEQAWAHEVFHKNGMLKRGKEEVLLEKLYGPKAYWDLHIKEMERSLRMQKKKTEDWALAQAELAHTFPLEM